MAHDFSGKVAFISGAARGQGRATALAFAREGASIVGFDVGSPLENPTLGFGTHEELDSLVKEVQLMGGQCIAFQGDVQDYEAIRLAVKAAADFFGRIDVLFNNDSICSYGPAHRLPDKASDEIVDINLKGPWLVARRVIPILISQKSGVIVNYSSRAGLEGNRRLGQGAGSTWGLSGLTKSWALELAPYGVRVVSIHSTGNPIPDPWNESGDFAKAVLRLASDRARFATGSEFILNTGLLAR